MSHLVHTLLGFQPKSKTGAREWPLNMVIWRKKRTTVVESKTLDFEEWHGKVNYVKLTERSRGFCHTIFVGLEVARWILDRAFEVGDGGRTLGLTEPERITIRW